MTTRVVALGPGHGIRHAAQIMLNNGISGLPMIDDDTGLEDARISVTVSDSMVHLRESIGFESEAARVVEGARSGAGTFDHLRVDNTSPREQDGPNELLSAVQ